MQPIAFAIALDDDYRLACARLGRDDPWHGAFGLEVGGQVRRYKVGRVGHPDLRILAWQHPYARAYYEGRPGEELEVDADDARGFAPVEGTVDHVAGVAARERSLARVQLEARDGRHVVVRHGAGFVVEGVVPAPRQTAHGLPDVLALLTPEQYRLITASRQRPVILQGRAGSGKTTVALHRVAWLTHPDASSGEPPVDPAKVLIVMFNKALSTFVEKELAPLGLARVQLDTFHGWALGAVRRAYAGDLAPGAIDHPGRATALALKRQLGILRLLDEVVARQAESLDAWLVEKLAPLQALAWVERFRQSAGPVVPRLVTLRREAMAARDAARTARQRQTVEQVVLVLRTAKERMTKYKEELLRSLSDRALLAKHLVATPAEVDQLIAYQCELQGVATPGARPGARVGFEDLALLLRLVELKNGGFPDRERDDQVSIFDHLVVDEAQDFGAVELTVLLAAVRSRTGVTIVGDLDQKIVPDADFVGWDALAEDLGINGADVCRLEVAHRSTRPIVALAATIAGEGPITGRDGPLPTLTLVHGAGERLDSVAGLVASALADLPDAHVCVVCPGPTDARHLAPLLAARLAEDGCVAPVRLGHNADFVFAPGVTVTNLRQIKGLEFDVVIVVDASAVTYPDGEQGRRWLYTVVTRAKDALHVVADVEAGAVTPLLDRARADGVIEVRDEGAVDAVAFGAEDEEPF